MAGLYIHVPFCASRCIYCDFYSTTLRGRGAAYVEALRREMAERRSFLHEAVRTVYVGGGTPSQLGWTCLGSLLQAVADNFDLSQCIETTVEVNPEDVTDDLRLPQPGLRISMGVQSMVDDELRLLHRRHDAQRVREAVERLRRAGVGNLSLDLMYGLPTQTLQSWDYSISEVLRLNPQHISAYNLMVEDGTRLSTLVRRGQLTPCDDDTCLAMARLLRDRLREAGYCQYEISNYALPGFHSRHNASYWCQTPYLGLGPGAHSYDGDRLRCWNEPYVLRYLRGQRCEGSETLSDTDLYNERLMLGLRTREGADIRALRLMHTRLQPDTDFDAQLHDLTARGLVCHDDTRLTLTEAGLALSDAVIRDLMIV